tara:strand:+ start:2701 stop:5361 length:2661 start_codon:yes stop_codon:yes gene_type:complete
MSDSNKPLNVGQQPNPPKFQKVYSETLQAKNIGVDKILLNINGANSELPTNKNSIIKYSLKQPIILEPGDMVTLVSSFVEEKGLAENTISFEEDFETEMRFLYYKQFDTGDTQANSSDVGFVQYPKLCPDVFNGTKDSRNTLVQEYLSFESYDPLYSSIVCDCGLNMDFSNSTFFGNDTDITSGSNGQLGYLMESCRWSNGRGASQDTYYRPVYGRKIIKVKAGNYSVDSLANIISEQMNGSIGAGDNSFSDALLDKLYRPDVSFNGTDNLVETLPYFRNITGAKTDVLDKDIFGDEKVFSDSTYASLKWERRVEGFTRQIYYSKNNYYDIFMYNQLVNDSGTRLDLARGDTYPNGRTDNNDFHYKDGNDRLISVEDILSPDFNSGKNASVNFYIGTNHLANLFENDYDAFYCNPKYVDGTIDDNDALRVPELIEMMKVQVGVRFGVTPFFSSNGAAYRAKFPTNDRIPKDVDGLTFNTMWPVNGLTFPGKDNLLPPRNKFAGTSVAEMTFSDSQANRFAFQNFHEFYKLPNITPDGKSTTDYGGQQATMFNNPFFNDEQGGSQADNDPVASTNDSTAVYPIDSSSGVMVNNFCFDLCKDTQIYKDAITKIRALDNDYTVKTRLYREKLLYDLLTKPFDKFFPDDESAKKVFDNSLWARLGFSYEQLGKISTQVESTSSTGGKPITIAGPSIPGPVPRNQGRQILKNKGIITHNQFDFSKIVSSDGLGLGNPVNTTAGVNLQNYRLADYYYGKPLTSNLGLSGNQIHLLANSKPLNAANLPSLSAGKSYLLIESDIIKPNFKDVRAGWGNLLGIMSKENATNDTIFGAEPIDFTITEPKLLSDITLYIKNPDGTLADDSVVGKNCGFIIQITKPIKPQEVVQLDPP